MILPEGTPIGLRLNHASLPGEGSPGGGRLSNTPSTYPRDPDNLGKLRLIRDRRTKLEGWCAESSRGHPLGHARGWDGGRSGSWWGNGPPSLRPVRAVGAGARSRPLRQGAGPYGAQQAGTFRNARKRDGGSPSATR